MVLEKGLSIDELEAIASLLHTEAEHMDRLAQREAALDRFKKALHLLEYVDGQADIYSFERTHRIDNIRGVLDQFYT
ncbi:MAG: hypothetical protein AAGI49_02390 [Bacteroidota bacterium]